MEHPFKQQNQIYPNSLGTPQREERAISTIIDSTNSVFFCRCVFVRFLWKKGVMMMVDQTEGQSFETNSLSFFAPKFWLIALSTNIVCMFGARSQWQRDNVQPWPKIPKRAHIFSRMQLQWLCTVWIQQQTDESKRAISLIIGAKTWLQTLPVAPISLFSDQMKSMTKFNDFNNSRNSVHKR